VVYTHSHVDHFGGVLGVISAEQARADNVPIVAPAGFLAEATSENVLVGTAMARRAMFMYGKRLARHSKGLVDNGLGKAVAFGSIGLIAPTVVVDQPQAELTLDGVRFVFHNVPDSEAPAEFTFNLPDLRAYCGAELMSHTLHNLYTLRGAKVRDALVWARFLDEALVHTADADVVFNQHHWPVWGQHQISEFITQQRDIYRYIHDQTVRQMNAGLNAADIAEQLRLPPSLAQHLSTRGYYGSVRHNVKAVYQYYLGWYDGHPANLDPLPRVEAGKRYVALAGGAEAIRLQARQALEQGQFRWAAELMKHAVYADPADTQARELMASAFDQLGYLAESAAWRNVYLSGALELRDGGPDQGFSRSRFVDMLAQTPIERFLEAMAASLDGVAAADSDLRINLVLSDRDESFTLWIENAVLHHKQTSELPPADATLTVSHGFFLRMVIGEAGAAALLTSSEARIDGSRLKLASFFGMLDKADGRFGLIEP
jgi:alkyl sulfatase BDS1-like metallo-beta-lactamase superfamily hydrolase